MNIVFVDADTIGSDIDLSGFSELGDVTVYGSTRESEMPERIREADVIIVNKTEVNARTVGEAPRLKLVCVSATGTNNLDMEFLGRRGIAWRNVAGYSTENVAQHTFALMFALLEKLSYYDDYVKSGKYTAGESFTHFSNVFHELQSLTWGIIGLGAIGRRVADIAGMFGCHVIYYSASGSPRQKGYEQVDLDTLLETSDIVSVHAPLNESTQDLMNAEAFHKMKNSAIFINVGRGPIVVEEDLADALERGEIAAAGLDVLRTEPMTEDNPLRRFRDSTKLLITPHIAWASAEARARLMAILLEQVRDFLSTGA
ncbi:MAG: D-2-hydroxyacid dehydrogenase [Lachnospiraceae bacterium]|nr:D-2-hydroxyacid dehydrogenase [Lachnospiraceae bacterium]